MVRMADIGTRVLPVRIIDAMDGHNTTTHMVLAGAPEPVSRTEPCGMLIPTDCHCGQYGPLDGLQSAALSQHISGCSSAVNLTAHP